ncbi:MAG: nicotinamidase [Microscillaceae bacterium]|nr:nicotinamidase [Microscillaceae bacterium]MDW8460885.1 nicotinamidase [Cytophagales bacterium]
MRTQKNAFLIIDPQYDFCNPNGALFVPGAEKDMERLAHFISQNIDKIDYICVTLDSHPINDISHPAFWQDKDGNFPPPFTQITSQDITEGKWTPRFEVEKATKYVQELEAQGKFLHFIWPQHCVIGSRGNAIDDTLFEALQKWAKQTGREYRAEIKGTNPLTEHFGIFMAQIPIPECPETQLNTQLIDALKQYENVFVAGEAKSHCVATSIKQAIDFAPELAQKMIIIEDCMTDVPNLGHLGEPIYTEARQKGIRFAKIQEIVLA